MGAEVSGETLILTSEQALAANDATILLGKWCIDYRQSLASIRNAENSVLPYPFDVNGALAQAYHYLQDVDKRLFPALVTQLNHLHQVDKSYRYWRIVAGYWWRE